MSAWQPYDACMHAHVPGYLLLATLWCCAAICFVTKCAMPHKTLFILLPPALVDFEDPMSRLLTSMFSVDWHGWLWSWSDMGWCHRHMAIAVSLGSHISSVQ